MDGLLRTFYHILEDLFLQYLNMYLILAVIFLKMIYAGGLDFAPWPEVGYPCCTVQVYYCI